MVSGDILLGNKTIKKLKEVTPIKVKVVIRSSKKKTKNKRGEAVVSDGQGR